MDDLILSPSWPAAPRTGATLVQHPAWERARNAVLDRAAEGPVTVFLTGEPGSGKTWLLRELAASLGQHGFPTMALLRGDLPVPLGDGVAVLVDEAGCMPDRTRAALAVQDRGVVVLADVQPCATPFGEGGPEPVMIHLELLADNEVGPFAAEWLQQEGISPAILDRSAVARLVAHGGGAVRLIAQLLTAALAQTRMSGRLELTGAVVDQVAAFRLGISTPAMTPETERALHTIAPVVSIDDPPAVVVHDDPPAVDAHVDPRIDQRIEEPVDYPSFPNSPVLDPAIAVTPPLAGWEPTRRFDYRWALAGTALAASVLAAVVAPGLLNRGPTVEATAPMPPALPAIHSAQTAAPADTAQVAAPSPAATTSPISTLPTPAAPVPAPVVSAGMAPASNAPVPTLPSETVAPTLADRTPPPPSSDPVPRRPVIADLPLRAAEMPPPTPIPATTAAAPSIPAAAPPVPVAPPPTPVVASAAPPQAIVPLPVLAETIAQGVPPAAARAATTGLVLVAQRGDTLERLYADIYRDRRAPPFADILAANPRPFKPGAIVVFPAPAGGWGKAQR